MIEINLLPEELRIKSEKAIQAKSAPPEAKKVFLGLGLLIGFILFFHFVLFGALALKNLHLMSLNQQWKKIEPERKKVEVFQKENAILSAENQAMQQLLALRIGLSEKFDSLSRDVPAGIWFNELNISEKGFTLKGSAVSLNKEEMGLINKFIDNLKNDKNFSANFDHLELGSANRRTIVNYDVIDFILTASIKR